MKNDPYAALGDTSKAPEFWRSVEHKERDEAVMADLDVEFPNGTVAPGGFNRRDALKLAGASLALGALTGCDKLPVRRPVEEILPFVNQPEHVIPGVRLQYATAMQRGEGAVGLLVEAHEGRPTKVEGNPNHSASLGASDVWAQAEVLKLYDPDRARAPKQAGAASTWEKWDAFATGHFGALAANQGKGLALLVEDFNGPTFERLLDVAKAKLPEARVYRWDPLAQDNALMGAELAFGPGAWVRWDLEAVKVVWSVDSDFLVSGPEHLKLARQFGTSRAVHTRDDVKQMKRLYASEAAFTTTGTNADHRLKLASGQQVELLRAVAKHLAAGGVELGELGPAVEGAALPPAAEKFALALAKDLAANKGSAAIIAGERQPPEVHALAYALTAALGGQGKALHVGQGEKTARTALFDSLEGLTSALNAGAVDTLFVFDANPVYTAPGGLRFAEAMTKAKTVVHAGVLAEETGDKATWHLPAAHFLEAWGDARAWDGTVSIVQPLILPLFGARATTSLLAQLVGEADTNDLKLVEGTWRAPGKPLADKKAWRKALHDGVVPDTYAVFAPVEPKRAELAAALGKVRGVAPSKDALELVAVHGHAGDGRLSNVSWIMELPDGMSKLVWDNAVLLSAGLAQALGIESAVKKNGYRSDVVKLSVDGRSLTAPTFVLPGLADATLVMTHGFGHAFGEVAKGVGVNVTPLLAKGQVVQGVTLTKTGATVELCSTQDHFSVPANVRRELSFAQMTAEPAGAADRTLGLGDRPLFRSGTAAAFTTDSSKLAREGDMPGTLLQPGTPKSRPSKPLQPHDEVTYEGQQWGMVIDLSACIGCNVCAVACVAENNIPVVGREQVMLGREMHWIRVDRYFTGDVDQPLAVHQPVACMHCENAPCEPVCPVSATTHDEEGLNSMAYNRCIGTRYCANNCPYKVRRYNYFDFTHSANVYVEPYWQERMKTLKLQRNPDVTVRYRGVMEKCTFCTQRVEEAKVAAKRAGQDRKGLPDGAVTPACAQACPTQAITFGNINDEASRVAKLKSSERNYEMLQELNVRPRTSYLARVRNENEELS